MIEDVKIINKHIQHVQKHLKDGVKFKKRYVDTMKKVVYSNGSFGTNNEESSEVGYKIFLDDKNNDVNLIYFSCVKSRRVMRYAVDSETGRCV